MSTPADREYTLPEIESIAKRADFRMRKEFASFTLKKPPKITPGIVRIVLEAARGETDARASTGGDHGR